MSGATSLGADLSGRNPLLQVQLDDAMHRSGFFDYWPPGRLTPVFRRRKRAAETASDFGSCRHQVLRKLEQGTIRSHHCYIAKSST